MAVQTNKGVHTETQKSINGKSKDKDNSSAHTFWLTGDLCKVQCSMSAKHQRQQKTDRTYRKCRSHKELHTAHHSCYSLLRTLNLLSLQNLWQYFSRRGLLRSWLPPWYDRWSYVPLTPEAVGLCQWKAPQGEQDQLRGSDDSHRLPRPEASSKPCKQPGSVCLK